MNMYKRHRYVGEIIIYAVKLYHRFSLSLRDIQEMLLYRGIDVTYEAIRYWCNKFGSVIQGGSDEFKSPVLHQNHVGKIITQHSNLRLRSIRRE